MAEINASDYFKTGGNSIANLVGITPDQDGVIYNAIGYFNEWVQADPVIKHGAKYVFDKDTPKNQHDGITKISPTVPWNGQISTQPNYAAGVGETDIFGSGCWLLVDTNSLSGEVSADDFGKAGGNTVQNLVGITPIVPNSVYRSVAYYNGTTFGGGTFVWAASQPKNTHNGGWIISPTVPWDGSPSTHAAYLIGTGETAPGTNGCWVKIFDDLTFEDYGALGSWNGTTGNNDTQEIQRAVDTAPEYTTIKGRKDAWYFYNSITQTRRLKINFNGARIATQTTPGLPSWRVRPGFGFVSPELRYNIVGGTAGTNFITMTTPSQASNFTPGEFVFLRSLEFIPGWDQSIGGSISRGSNGISEATRVLSVDTGTGVVTFNKPLEKTYRTLPAFTGVTYTRDASNLVTAVFPSNHNFTVNQGFSVNTPTGGIVASNYSVATIVDPVTITFYTTGPGQTGGATSGTFNVTAVTPQIWKWREQMDFCGISNIQEINEIDPGGPAPTSTFPHLFHFWACISPQIYNVYANGFQMHVFNFDACEKPIAWNISCEKPFRPELGGHGYLGQFTGGTYGGIAYNTISERVRHSIDFTGCYDCVSFQNYSLDPIRAAFYAHGLGSKRCKSIDDVVYFTEGSNSAAGGWAIGNPAFAADFDFNIVRPVSNAVLNFGGGQSIITFGFRSLNLKIDSPRFYVGRNASNSIPVGIIRMMAGADSLELRNADINAFGFSTATSDPIVDVRPAYTTNPSDAGLLSIRPKNIKIFGGTYNVATSQLAFSVDCDGEIIIRPDEIIGAGNAIALDLKSTSVPTIFEYETLLTGSFANDIIRGPTPAATMIWYENLRRPTTTTVTTRASTGMGAIDLQRTRTSGTQGATGDYAVVLGGRNCTSGGTNSFSVGGTASAPGSGAGALGNDTLANGPNSLAVCSRSSTKNRQGALALSSSTAGSSTGVSQLTLHSMHVDTTNNTATRLITGALTGAATASNQFVIPSNTSVQFDGMITARNTANSDTKGWRFSVLIQNAGGTTSLVGTPTVNVTGSSAGATWPDPVISADNTLDCLAITVTGAAATNIRWNASYMTSEVN